LPSARKRTLEDDVRDHLVNQTRFYEGYIDRLEEYRRDINDQGGNMPPLVHPPPLPKAPTPKRRRRS
jgi:hypothetical protein